MHKYWEIHSFQKYISFAIHQDFPSLLEYPKIYDKLLPCWSKSRERALYSVQKKNQKQIDECDLKFLLNYLHFLQDTTDC